MGFSFTGSAVEPAKIDRDLERWTRKTTNDDVYTAQTTNCTTRLGLVLCNQINNCSNGKEQDEQFLYCRLFLISQHVNAMYIPPISFSQPRPRCHFVLFCTICCAIYLLQHRVFSGSPPALARSFSPVCFTPLYLRAVERGWRGTPTT